MSVDDPRHAAAQRTAAQTRGKRAHRVRLAATWFFIVPLLSFFSFSVVAGAKTFSKPDVAGAVAKLPSDEHVIQIAVGSNDKSDKKDKAKNKDEAGSDEPKNLDERFKHADHYVCSVTGSQLVRIQQRWRTSRLALDVRDRTIDIVAVYDAGESDLRSYLGSSGVTCVLVQMHRVFFLPFDAHTS